MAQGSIFVIFGDNLGPANIVQVSAFPLPTTAGLAGTSVRVTVGGTVVNAIMLYTLKTQVAAVLPSSTPLGTVTVTYNGVTSNAAPIIVLAGSFGTFTRNQGGTGPSIIQNFITEANQPFNTLVESARPGQVVTLWGTGLGPVTGNEAGQPLPGNLSNVNARLFVGGRETPITYRWRSGCCVGIDQVVFTVPQDVSGCFAPVSLQVGNIVSNFTTMSVAPNGGICSDPGGYTPAELEQARNSGGLRIGSMTLSKSSSSFSVPGVGSFDIKSDAGGAAFFRYTFDQLLSNAGSDLNVSNPGACAVSISRVGAGGNTGPVFTPLNAGPAINVSGPTGAKQMAAASTGIYSGVFSQTVPFGAAEPDYLVPGTYTLNNGGGGSDVGAFTTTHTVPPGTVWSNQAAITTVNRAAGQLVTWTGGDPNGLTYIAGASINVSNTAQATFVCLERTSAGQFNIPSSILLALPPSGSSAGVPFGFMFVGAYTTPGRFTAPGLDFGYTSYISTISKSVSFQ
ncbi:MAG: hypothetical protein EXQ56_06995 [Acidobacteria bacterium]|nr:hypothetical protein [Acidobacteriota bacterium]